MNVEILDKDLVYNIGVTLLHSLWQITVVYLILTGLNKMFRKGSSRLRYNLSYLSLILVFMLSVGTFIFYQNREKSSVIIVEKYDEMPVPGNTDVSKSALPAPPDKSVITTKSTLDENPWYLPYLVYGYFIGLLILGIRLLAGFLYLRKFRFKGLTLVSPDIEEKFQRLLDRFPKVRNIELRESILARVPMVLGYFKPLIIVPAGTFAHIPFNQMEAILAHEIAHIQRNDYLQNIFQSIIEVVFFYHPLVYLISVRIRKERENCCDDIALKQCSDTTEYVKALANLEELKIKISYPAVALGHKRSHLLERINRILNQNTMKTKVSDRIFAGIIVIAGFATILLTGSATLSIGQARNGDPSAQDASIHLKNNAGPEIVFDTIINIDNGKITTQRKNKKGKEETIEMNFSEGRLSSVRVDDAEVPPEQYSEFRAVIEASLEEVRKAAREVALAEQELARVDMEEVERELQRAREEMEAVDIEQVRAEALEELAKARAEIDAAEMERMQAEMARINMDSIQREVKEAMAEVDWEEINREIENAINEAGYQNEEVRRALEEARIAMEESMDIDISGIIDGAVVIAMESIKMIDLEMIGQSIEIALREAERAMRELDVEMQAVIEGSMEESTRDSIIQDIEQSKKELKEEKTRLEKLEKDMEKALEELEDGK